MHPPVPWKKRNQSDRLEVIPVVSFMTGAPPLTRNGGLWKFIKSGILDLCPSSTIMTHAFHFTDFKLSPRMVEKWLNPPIGHGLKGWIEYEDPPAIPNLFVDSGGFQLMNGPTPDLRPYGVELSPRGILRLQERMGGNAVAALDEPLHPSLIEDEVRRKQRKNLNNATFLLRNCDPNNEPFPYLPVHGIDRKTADLYTQKLILRAFRHGYDAHQFGLALGSLVPIRSNVDLIFDLLHGIFDGLESHGLTPSEIPVHIFGVSGPVIPFLEAFGVTSCDSSSYVQAARNLRYTNHFPHQQERFLELQELDCNCIPCQIINRGGLNQAKRILISQGYGKHEFDGRSIIKSELYGLIALHNLIRTCSAPPLKTNELVEKSIGSVTGIRLLRAALRQQPTWEKYVPNESLEKIGNLEWPTTPEYPVKKKSMTPQDFDLTKFDYQPKGPLILILPCSLTKPYSESSLRKRISNLLDRLNDSNKIIEIVTLSGLYGPVPYSFETAEAIKSYDFRLTPHHHAQFSLLVRRTTAFLKKCKNKNFIIAGIFPNGVYRNVIKQSSKKALMTVDMWPNDGNKNQFRRNGDLELFLRDLIRRNFTEYARENHPNKHQYIHLD